MTTRRDYEREKIRAVFERAKCKTIPDAGLSRVEFITRVMLAHPDGATPGHFREMPGYHELNAHICRMRNTLHFQIESTKVAGKRYHKYWFNVEWYKRVVCGQGELF